MLIITRAAPPSLDDAFAVIITSLISSALVYLIEFFVNMPCWDSTSTSLGSIEDEN